MKSVLMEKLDEKGEDVREFNEALNEMAQGLRAKAQVTGLHRRGLPEIEVEGEDQEILVNLINERFGIAPMRLSQVKVNQKLKGFVTGWELKEGLSIDVGLRIPSYLCAVYPSSSIKTQLGDGDCPSIERIVKHFCLVEGFPVETIVTDICDERVAVDLSSRQIDNLWNLDSDPSHKLVIVGCLKSKLEKMLYRSGISRYIFRSVSLALKVHLLYCIFGIDADVIKGKIETGYSGLFKCSVDSLKPSLRRISVKC